MDYRDAATYLWQGLFALAIPVFLVGVILMWSDPAGFPVVAFAGIGLAAIAIIPWAISMADDRPVDERKGGWL